MCVGKKKQKQNQKEQEKIGITKWMQYETASFAVS